NGGNGVVIAGPDHYHNCISCNQIADNAKLGIDLNADGVTANDQHDADDGPNGLQNYPTLFEAWTGNGHTVIQGALTSKPNQTYHLEFFSSPATPGTPEGATYLGAKDVTTDAAGAVFFAAAVAPVPTGTVITATATDAADNTSEFSGSLITIDAPPKLFAVGADAGGPPTVRVYNADGSKRFNF